MPDGAKKDIFFEMSAIIFQEGNFSTIFCWASSDDNKPKWSRV